MSKGLTTEQKAKVALNEIKTRILLTIVINNQAHDIIRILENDTIASLTIEGQPYLAAQVKRGTIENKIEGGRQKVSVTLSNINKPFTRYC